MTRPCNPTTLLRRNPLKLAANVRCRRYATFSEQSSSPAKPTRQRLRIGYVPEHFSTPLAFAHQRFNLNHDLIPQPLGTGALASQLKAHADEKQLDIAIGLTEGFVADLGKTKVAGYEAGYGLVGTYVESPLCWAISTGGKREQMGSVQDLKGKRVGVSRMGSGSYIMSTVLADQQGWLGGGGGGAAFEPVVVGDFAKLRQSVNLQGEESRQFDFFMWEHFTTKKYWDNGELRRIGEIYTPWASWMIAARHSVEEQLPEVIEAINKGVQYFKENPEEAVRHITSTMHYSEDDAREWMKTVRFPDDVRGVEARTVDNTVGVLQKAGVLKQDAGGAEHMIAIRR